MNVYIAEIVIHNNKAITLDDNGYFQGAICQTTFVTQIKLYIYERMFSETL